MSPAPLDDVVARLELLGALVAHARGACFWCGSRGRAHAAEPLCSCRRRRKPETPDPLAPLRDGLLHEFSEACRMLRAHRRTIFGGDKGGTFSQARLALRPEANRLFPTGPRWRWRKVHEAVLRRIRHLRAACEAGAPKVGDRHAAAALLVVGMAAREWDEALGEALGTPAPGKRWYRFAPILEGVKSSLLQGDGPTPGRRTYRVTRPDLLAG